MSDTTSEDLQDIFTPEELQRFKRFKEKISRMMLSHKGPLQSNFHTRGYDKGDLRCIRCRKWLNPNDPQEAKEIQYGKGGKRHHFRCPVWASYPATLSMVSRQKSRLMENGRRGRSNETAKRY